MQQQTPQSQGSAITYARRYALCAVLGIAGDDDDGQAGMNAAAPVKTVTDEPVTPKQKILIASKLTELGIRREDMQGYLTEQYGVTHPEQMTKADASMIIDALMGNQS